MRRLVLSMVFVIASCTGPAPSEPAVATPDLAAAAERYEAAQINGDAAALNELLADDYLLVGSDGTRQDKSELIAFWTAEGFDPAPVTVTDPVAHRWTNGAALGGTVTLSWTQDGAPVSVTIRYIDIWALRDGEWRVVYGQATRAPWAIPGDSAAAPL